MLKLIKRHSKKVGLHPGAIVHTGEKKIARTKITYIDYDEKELVEKEVKEIEECFHLKDKSTVSWINIDGVHDTSIIEKIGSHFNIHPLILEDITNTGQRPKIEELDDYIFIVLNMLVFDDYKKEIYSEQISLILGKNFVISFQESVSTFLNPVKDHIKNSKGKIRKSGSDYLAYSIMDAIVDNYFVILEKAGEHLEDIEENLINSPSPTTLEDLYNMKREMLFLRKSVWPLREVINNMQRSDSEIISETTDMYLRDIYDNTIQIMDAVETFRDMLGGMLDIYLSSVSNRLNEIMKILTIISTVFIPMTFITGIYGMNFRYMPELASPVGYLGSWIVMIGIAVMMLLFVKKKGWI